MRVGEANHLAHVIGIGWTGRAMMPFSEVCMHMGCADQYMDFQVLDDGNGNPCVLLYSTHSSLERYSQIFSAPITTGEAGLFDAKGVFDTEFPCFYYPHGLNEAALRDTGKLDEEASKSPAAVEKP